LKSLYDQLEALVIGVVLAFPLFGTFMPLETYLRPRTFDSLYAQESVQTFDFSHIVFLGVAALTIYLMLVYSRAMQDEVRRGALLLAWIGLTFASAAWSPDPATTMRRALRLLEYSVFAFYLVHKYDIVGFTRFITRVLAVSVFASFAILALRPDLGLDSSLEYHGAVRGAFIDKNILGGIMSLTVLSAGYSLFIRANSRIFAGVVLLGSLVLLVLSRSATSNIVVLTTIGLALYGWIVRRRTNPGWRIMGAILTVIGIAAVTLGGIYFADVLEIAGRSATLTRRTDVWRAVAEAIRQRPLLGYGYGFWEEPSVARNNIWLELNWAAPHAHNGWLDVTLQLGIVGLSITVVLWLVSLSRAIRLALFTGDAGALFMALIIVNTFIRSVTETVMLDPFLATWLWFVVAYLHLARMAAANKGVSAIPATAIRSRSLTSATGERR
jgi:O-antigen ligase